MGRPPTSLAELKAARKLLQQRGLPSSRYQLQKATGAAYATLERLIPLLDLPEEESKKFSGLNEKLAEMLLPVAEGLFQLAEEQFSVERNHYEERITETESLHRQQNDTIKRLMDEKTALEKKLQGIQTDFEATISALTQAEAEKLALENKCSIAEKICQERMEQIGTLRQQVEKSRLDLEHFRDASVRQREREQQEVAREKLILATDKKELKQEIATLESQINKLKGDISSHLQTISRLSTDFTHATRNADKADKADKAERAKESLESKCENYREKNTELSREIAELKQENKQALVDLAKVSSTLATHEKELKRLATALEQANKQQTKLESQVEAKESLIKQMLKKK